MEFGISDGTVPKSGLMLLMDWLLRF